ncbi:hypothetical protein TNIN_478441 [Trichonephila inaurata madagascariensis]|uniref:Uncharacterized protein n=1 Tax=Trichonephila inaurata madagascariensis TaxID=2747483 RepID=A0A8X6YNR9_9ARAC|nr:hypothetical protein TNIN_478441 [Trichonephila inaurata madagascariensis]
MNGHVEYQEQKFITASVEVYGPGVMSVAVNGAEMPGGPPFSELTSKRAEDIPRVDGHVMATKQMQMSGSCG